MRSTATNGRQWTVDKVSAMALNKEVRVSQMKSKMPTTHRRTEKASTASVKKTHACYIRGTVGHLACQCPDEKADELHSATRLATATATAHGTTT